MSRPTHHTVVDHPGLRRTPAAGRAAHRETVAPCTVAARVIERVSARPAEVVVDDGVDRLTGSAFADRVHQLARALSRHGVGPDQVVVLIAPAVVEALAVRYACALLGAATALCPHRSGERAVDDFAAMVGAEVVVVWPATAAAARIATRAPRTRLVLGIGAVTGADVDLALAAASEPADPVPDRSVAGAPALFVVSGGTTGAPKASRRSVAAWSHVVDGPVDPTRRQLVTPSLAHIGQILADQTLLGGGTVVLREGFDAADTLATVESERITHLCLVEPLLVEFVDHPDFASRDLSCLRALSHVGAAAPASLLRRLLRRTGPVLVHPYGASEAGIVSVLGGADYSLDRPDLLSSAGRPVPGTRVRVLRPDGSAAATGEPGELVVRSLQVADGYPRPLDGSGFRADGYHPGDVGILDTAGYLHVRGRAGDVRRVLGTEVFPVDVDDALCDLPGVRYAVTVPTASGFVTVVVTDGRGVTAEVLAEQLRARHGAHLVPEELLVVERIPVTEQGKPDRARILAEVQSAAAGRGGTSHEDH